MVAVTRSTTMNSKFPITRDSGELPVARADSLPTASRSAICRLFGHSVHHTKIAGAPGSTVVRCALGQLGAPVARVALGQLGEQGEPGALCTRCGDAILDLGNHFSHVTHTLSCFFGGHHYVLVASRTGHREYVCERCGHPLLFERDHDPYAGEANFKKRVSYGCGLFGHRVHVVATRSNVTEYACVCGHSFVKTKSGMNVIRHPLACMAWGHFISLHEIRGEWAEYVCRRCGHPFCFKLEGFASHESTQEQALHG